jgi:hypothetical protein
LIGLGQALPNSITDLPQFTAHSMRQESMQPNDVFLFSLNVVVVSIDQEQEEEERG